jgi:hypothetical protein
LLLGSWFKGILNDEVNINSYNEKYNGAGAGAGTDCPWAIYQALDPMVATLFVCSPCVNAVMWLVF